MEWFIQGISFTQNARNSMHNWLISYSPCLIEYGDKKDKKSRENWNIRQFEISFSLLLFVMCICQKNYLTSFLFSLLEKIIQFMYAFYILLKLKPNTEYSVLNLSKYFFSLLCKKRQSRTPLFVLICNNDLFHILYYKKIHHLQ